MSDISEHDSDSDTEIERKKKTSKQLDNEKPSDLSNPGASDISKDDAVGSDLVEELKQQAAANTAHDDTRPEWEKYMHQNEVTGAYTYTDPNDGTIYEWDNDKRGWIPKIDDDFIAMYQANYGFTASGEHDPSVNVTTEQQEPAKAPDDKEEKKIETKNEVGTKRKQEEKKEWFNADQSTNNNVYVSGLPESTTEEEFIELMSKCGIIMQDDTGKMKVKMYKNSDGTFKGDARCCYLRHESVTLACQILDESEINGNTIHVEQAVFELKGEYNPSLKPKKKKKKKKANTQEKLLDWVERPEKRSKFDRIVIFKNMFDHKEFEKDPTLINDLKKDLRSQGEKFGDIKKVLVFDRNPLGVASILFREAEDADKCIAALNNRLYAGRNVTAETYDGVTKYEVQETEEEMEKRLREWERFIGDDDDDDNTS